MTDGVDDFLRRRGALRICKAAGEICRLAEVERGGTHRRCAGEFLAVATGRDTGRNVRGAYLG